MITRFLFILSCLPALAWGQAPMNLSLAESEALWRAHSRELALSRTAVEGAEADVQTAGQRPNPFLSLGLLSISPSSGIGAGRWKDKKMDNVLRVDQVIERGDKRALRVRGAESRLEAARQDLDDTARQQLAELRRAYYGLLLAQDKARLAQESAQLQARGLEVAERRLKAGDIAPVEVSRLAVDKARADNDARQAQSELEQARYVLAYLIGREREAASLQASDPWPAVQAGAEEANLAARPDLEAARRRVAAAEADRDLARALRHRDVSVGMQVERNNQNAPTNSVGFGVSVPLFLWHEHEGDIRRAEADYNAARLQLAQLEAQVGGQLGQLGSALRAARDRLQRLEQGLLADAERVAAAAELAYAKGAMNLMDLLDARRTLRQVRIEAATARAEYAMARSDWQLAAEYGKEQ